MMKKIFGFIILLFFIKAAVAQEQPASFDANSLPAINKLNNGKNVRSKKVWEQKRRPQLLNIFSQNVYGSIPVSIDSIHFNTLEKNSNALNNTAEFTKTAIEVFRNNKKVSIQLLLFVPKSQKAVPVFLLINHRGMATMNKDGQNKDNFWPVEEVLKKGYAIAGFDVADVAPDSNETYSQKLLTDLYPEYLNSGNATAALSAWAWAASRCVDFLVTDSKINKEQIMVVGHSRSGKAAIWCGANDKRIAITFSNESGEGGAALSKRMSGERIADITRVFPYWFTPNYKKYVGRELEMPFDQHMLLSTIAPRGLYVASAANDAWADPAGELLSLKYAQTAWKYYGIQSDFPSQLPALGEQIISGKSGYHIRAGDHDLTLEDWMKFVAFADYYFRTYTK